MYFYGYLVTFESLAIACRPCFSFISICYFGITQYVIQPRIVVSFFLFSTYQHLSAACRAAWSLAQEFAIPTIHTPCFAYPCTYMLLSHVMLSMYFMHTLLGNASLSDDIPIIYFFPRQMSPVLLVKLLHSGILRLIQSPPDGLIRLFLHLHVLGMLFFRGFATIGFLVLYLFLLFPKVLSVFLLGPSRPSTHLRRLQTYILALSADTINSLPFTFVNFDVDTYDVAFDNCTSYCVTNDKADYILTTTLHQHLELIPFKVLVVLLPLLVLELLPGVVVMTMEYCILSRFPMLHTYKIVQCIFVILKLSLEMSSMMEQTKVPTPSLMRTTPYLFLIPSVFNVPFNTLLAREFPS